MWSPFLSFLRNLRTIIITIILLVLFKKSFTFFYPSMLLYLLLLINYQLNFHMQPSCFVALYSMCFCVWVYIVRMCVF